MQKNAKKIFKMINIKDQEDLFELISNYLEEDIICVAIGGTAMMFEGYKTTTKDIDLVFKNNKDRNIFIKAIEKLGYSKRSLKLVYEEKNLKSKDKPLMYSRGEERFDLFVKNVFGIKVNFEEFLKRHDYIGKKELVILTLSKEDLILFKSVTNREKDYEDIETIVKLEPNIDWDKIVDSAIKQKMNNHWILIDLEEKLQKLKKITIIKNNVFDKIYKIQENK